MISDKWVQGQRISPPLYTYQLAKNAAGLFRLATISWISSGNPCTRPSKQSSWTMGGFLDLFAVLPLPICCFWHVKTLAAHVKVYINCNYLLEGVDLATKTRHCRQGWGVSAQDSIEPCLVITRIGLVPPQGLRTVEEYVALEATPGYMIWLLR